jgi:hypothetical protein
MHSYDVDNLFHRGVRAKGCCSRPAAEVRFAAVCWKLCRKTEERRAKHSQNALKFSFSCCWNSLSTNRDWRKAERLNESAAKYAVWNGEALSDSKCFAWSFICFAWSFKGVAWSFVLFVLWTTPCTNCSKLILPLKSLLSLPFPNGIFCCELIRSPRFSPVPDSLFCSSSNREGISFSPSSVSRQSFQQTAANLTSAAGREQQPFALTPSETSLSLLSRRIVTGASSREPGVNTLVNLASAWGCSNGRP